MRTLGDLINAAEKVDMNFLISLSLIDSQEEYVRLQREQMLQGLKQDGRPIFNLKTGRDTYSPGYAKYKGKSKPIDLYDKGPFQEGIFIHVDDAQTFVEDSADSKSGKIQETYGSLIFGLNEESNVKFIPIARQNLFNEVVNELSK